MSSDKQPKICRDKTEFYADANIPLTIEIPFSTLGPKDLSAKLLKDGEDIPDKDVQIIVRNDKVVINFNKTPREASGQYELCLTNAYGEDKMKLIMNFLESISEHDKCLQVNLGCTMCEIMRLDSEYHDVQLTTKSGDLIKAHRLVVGTRSSKMSEKLKERQSLKIKHIIDILDINEEVLTEFIKFLYTNTLPGDIPIEKVLILYQEALSYDVPNLKLECIRYCEENLVKNIDKILEACLNLDEDFKVGIVPYILRRAIFNKYIEDVLIKWITSNERFHNKIFCDRLLEYPSLVVKILAALAEKIHKTTDTQL